MCDSKSSASFVPFYYYTRVQIAGLRQKTRRGEVDRSLRLRFGKWRNQPGNLLPRHARLLARGQVLKRELP